MRSSKNIGKFPLVEEDGLLYSKTLGIYVDPKVPLKDRFKLTASIYHLYSDLAAKRYMRRLSSVPRVMGREPAMARLIAKKLEVEVDDIKSMNLPLEKIKKLIMLEFPDVIKIKTGPVIKATTVGLGECYDS